MCIMFDETEFLSTHLNNKLSLSKNYDGQTKRMTISEQKLIAIAACFLSEVVALQIYESNPSSHVVASFVTEILGSRK